MEFKVYQKELELQSRGWIPTFHDVSKEIMEIVAASGVKNGTVCIASHHTTCSVMIQECSHDIDSFDLEYLQHDLLDIMRKMIPDFAEDSDMSAPDLNFNEYGGLSGSRLTMDLAAANFMRFTGADIRVAFKCAATNPAAALRIDDRVGSIRAGLAANLVVVDESFRIHDVFFQGERVDRDAIIH